MTGRDRIVVVGLAALAVLAAVWLLAVAPEREKAATLATEVSAAQAQLSSAESQLASAARAQAQYEAAYTSIVSLGKAVPADQEVPSLIYQLAQATGQKNVEFASITSGGAGGASAGSPASKASAATGASSATSASATAGAPCKTNNQPPATTRPPASVPPAGQGLTGGATSAGPAGTGTQSASTGA